MGKRAKQEDHLVEQGPSIPIGPDHAFMNSAGQGDREHALCCRDEHADRLKGMAHDVLGLGAGGGVLMQQLDCGHLATAFGDFDAVTNENEAAVDPEQTGKASQDHLSPQRSHGGELDGRAVEGIQQPVVALLLQAEGADRTGDTEQVGSHRHSGHAGCKPQEAAQASARRPELPSHRPPMHPQPHRLPPCRLASEHSIYMLCSNDER